VVSIYEALDEGMASFDENEKREAYLGFFKNTFPFLLCPALFKRNDDLPSLNWVRVKYDDHAGHDFPEQQGVYMFMVSVESQKLPMNSYVMYVGKAGDTDSSNTIAKRFMDYVNVSGYKKRPKVKKLLKYFSEHLFYYYSVVPDGDATSVVERALADIFVPPCCQMDFSGEVRSLLRGVRII
jgi:hypothetical protein